MRYSPAAESMIYECVRCGKRARADEWHYPGTTAFKCPQCSYKVSKKVRAPIVKRVKTL